MEDEVNLEYVPTKDQIANIFTKSLPQDTFEYPQVKLVAISPPFLN
jgi:hypothetical protein